MHSLIDQYRRREKVPDQTKSKQVYRLKSKSKYLFTRTEFVKLCHKKRLRAFFNKLVPLTRTACANA
jgi:hypothetical protein